MLETAVVEATLHRALAGGGDFADVFVEDRAVTSATYDDGKVEEMRSGRSRGAGIRVVRGRDHRLRPHHRPHRGGPRDRGRRGGGRGARPGARARASAALTRRDAPAPHDGRDAARRRWPRRARSRCWRGPTTRPGPSRTRSARSRRATPTRGARSSSPTPTACSRPTTRCARASRCTCVASGDTGLQTGHGGARSHDRVRVLRRAPARGDRPHRRGACRRQARRRVPRRAARCRSCCGAGAGGVLFHEACGHGLEADLVEPRRVGVPRDGRRAGRGPGVTLVDDGTLRARLGRVRDRRRGRARAAQRADRRRRAHRLHVGPRAGPPRGSRRAPATAGARRTSTCRWCA